MKEYCFQKMLKPRVALAQAGRGSVCPLNMRAGAGMLICTRFSAIFLSLFRWTNELYNNADRR
jgi:hypothetical protein